MQADVLTLTPQLPSAWSRLAFPIVWKGQRAFVDITDGSAAVTNRSDAPLDVQVWGRRLTIDAGETETFAKE